MRFPKWGFTLPWVSPRWEVKRLYSTAGDRRVSFYLRRNGRFEYTVEKRSQLSEKQAALGQSNWQSTYQSEEFDGLIEAKTHAREGFSWIQED